MAMLGRAQSYVASPTVVEEFLCRTLPFSDLERDRLVELARQCTVDFHPKGVRIMTQDETELDCIYLIQKGGVKLFLTGEDGESTLLDFRGEGACVGILSFFRDSKANMNVETIEDTFFFRIPSKIFAALVRDNPSISQFFLKTFSEAYVSRAFSELRSQRQSAKTETGLSLVSIEVHEIIRHAPVSIHGEASIREAAIEMVRHGIGSLVVRDEDRLGIVTDKDFRYKVVAQGLSYDRPVKSIMTAPLVTISPKASLFDALLVMMKNRIHHLAVIQDGGVSGMITAHDIMVLQGRSPFSLFKEIGHETTVDGLVRLIQEVPSVVRNLIDEGAKASNVQRLLTVVHDLVLERLLTLLQEEFGPPPTSFCWLALGEDGRKELVFRIEGSVALVFSDPPNEAAGVKAREYFLNFGRRVCEALVICVPAAAGQATVTFDEDLCRSLSVWQDMTGQCLARPSTWDINKLSALLDFRPAFGHLDLGYRLKDHIVRRAKTSKVLIQTLAEEFLVQKAPLSFFRNFIVEKDGEHKNRLDVRSRGIKPFVDFARLLAVKNGLTETNTLSRLRLLESTGVLPKELAQESIRALEFFKQVRLVHRLDQIEAGQRPDDFVEPGRLFELEKRTLKEAFTLIGRMQTFVRETI